MNDLFEEKVLKVVAQIPLGCVATYGQIAQLIGYPRHAHQVGKVLATSTKADLSLSSGRDLYWSPGS